MDPALRDMIRWTIGFGLVSTLYLVAVIWLIGRVRKRRLQKKTVPKPGAGPAGEA